MTFNELATMIAKKEGRKKQVDIAQISEVLGLVCDCVHAAPTEVLPLLFAVGKRRDLARKRRRKKK